MLTEKRKLVVDKKNTQLRVDRKKIKKIKVFMEHRTHANSPPKAHTQKPNGGGYA
jgi:hypothetical protein